MYSVPTAISPAKSGDSMTLNLSSWLGLPAIPFIVSFQNKHECSVRHFRQHGNINQKFISKLISLLIDC